MANWKDYQVQIADFLRQLGFVVQEDEVVQGARGNHAVDVTARSSVAGIEQLWVIECKAWKRRVPKERVLLFREIVNDVGADRGLIFAEGGFQAGAKDVVRKTNVTLTSLADFEEDSSEDVYVLTSKVLDDKAARLIEDFMLIWDLPERERLAAFSRYAGARAFPGMSDGSPSDSMAGVTSILSALRTSLEHGRFARWPVTYFPMTDRDFEFYEVKNWEGLLFVADRTIVMCQKIYDQMFGSNLPLAHWMDLQPVDLRELLESVRQPNVD